jgi:hypothetical protein
MAKWKRHAAATTELFGRVNRAVRLTAHAVEEIWTDGVARWCGLCAIAFTWLAAALTEPAFVPLAFAAAASARFRLKHKPDEPTDELF